MGRLHDDFAFYGSYHANETNQRIHMVFIPMIYMTAMVFFTGLDATSILPSAVVGVLPAWLPPNGAFVANLVYVLYYLYLSPTIGFIGSLLVTGLLVIGNLFAATFGASAWQYALALHIVAWVAQFYGHGVHEGRAPALFDSLFQSLFAAPLFVTIETLMAFGFMKEFQQQVQPMINKRIKEMVAAGNTKKIK